MDLQHRPPPTVESVVCEGPFMDITDIIAEQHDEQRRLFGYIQELKGSESDALTAIWNRLHGLLDAHAEGEEKHFYPRLLQQGTGAADGKSAKAETLDAIKDHNDIRDAATAVGGHQVGSSGWFDAVAHADVVNSKHMSEEERQALADFRHNVSTDERHALGRDFLAFVSAHLSGVKPVDKNPQDYVRAHEHGRQSEHA